MKATCAMVLGLCVLGASFPADANIFTVTKAVDADDSVCDADCSLREAVGAANANPGFDEVVIPPGTYVLDLPAGTLVVDDPTLVRGAGPGTTTVDGNDAANTFTVVSTSSVEIRGLTIEGGVNSGIVNTSGTGSLTVRNCTLRNNFIGLNNGNSQSMYVFNTTIAGNTAGVGRDVATTTTFDNVTITDNDTGIGGASATLIIRNTIVAGNLTNCTAASLATDSNNSIDDDGSCGLAGSGDLSNVADPGLLVLAGNGGPTDTVGLCTGLGSPDISCTGPSPALDAGSNFGCVAVDQRGLPRADGDADGAVDCDIGALEVQASILDDVKCYKAKDLKNPRFTPVEDLIVDDGFGNDPDVDVKKPGFVCSPAGIDGDSVLNANTDLCCYKAKGAKLDPVASVRTTDGFGTFDLRLDKPGLLCRPCATSAVP